MQKSEKHKTGSSNSKPSIFATEQDTNRLCSLCL